MPDDPARLLAVLEEMAEVADLIVTTGGVSAGDHDVVKAALGERAEFWFGSVAVKPGRPQGCGVVTSARDRCRPQGPRGGCLWCACRARRWRRTPRSGCSPSRRSAHSPGAVPVAESTAVLDAPVDVAADRTLVLPAAYVGPGRVAQLAGHVGHSQRLLAAADVLIVVPPGAAPLPAGSRGRDPVPLVSGGMHGAHD